MKDFIKTSALVLLLSGLIIIIHSCNKKSIPVLTTSDVTNITGTTASSGGIIISEGSGTVIARGVCWGTSIDPTIEENKTTDGAGAGSFTSDISGLKGTTTYYLRAYATNSAGTAYGNEIRFTTNSTFTGSVFYNNNGKIINAVCYGYFRDGQAPGSILTEAQIFMFRIKMKLPDI